MQNLLDDAAQIGYSPIWLVDSNAYLQSFADWNATGNGDNATSARRSPVRAGRRRARLQQYLDIVEANGGDISQLGRAGHVVLPAVGHRGQGCGAELTRQCVLDELAGVTSWDGGAARRVQPRREHAARVQHAAQARRHDLGAGLPRGGGRDGLRPRRQHRADRAVVDQAELDENRSRPSTSSSRRSGLPWTLPAVHDPRPGHRGRVRHRRLGPGRHLHHVGHLQLRPRGRGHAGLLTYWQLRSGGAGPPPWPALVPCWRRCWGRLLYGVVMRGLRNVRGHPHRRAGQRDARLPALSTWIWDPTPCTPRLFLLFFGADKTVTCRGEPGLARGAGDGHRRAGGSACGSCSWHPHRGGHAGGGRRPRPARAQRRQARAAGHGVVGAGPSWPPWPGCSSRRSRARR